MAYPGASGTIFLRGGHFLVDPNLVKEPLRDGERVYMQNMTMGAGIQSINVMDERFLIYLFISMGFC